MDYPKDNSTLIHDVPESTDAIGDVRLNLANGIAIKIGLLPLLELTRATSLKVKL